MSGIQKKQQNKRTQTKSPAKKDSPKTTQSVNLEQLISAPETLHTEEILAAQRQVGNQVVQRALDGQKKRKATTDEQGYLKGEINDAIQKKRGGGSPLPESLRDDAGKRLGHDFGDVRIHTDEQANKLSQSINARAFTIGKDIFFKKGVFSPGSRAGRETLMHELTHVVQQSGSNGANGRLKLGGTDTAHEKQADKIGKANSGDNSVKSASNSKGTVQRLQGRLDALRGKKITEKEDEEKLQKQPDPAVQREEMPEEELMMQEEEEELQMQPDTGVIQRQTEKEKSEEYKKAVSMLGVRGNKKQRERYFSTGKEHKDMSPKEAKTSGKETAQMHKTMLRHQDVTSQIKEKAGDSGDFSGFGLKHVDDKDKSYRDAPVTKMSGKEKEQLTKNVSKGKLMDVLRDPSKSPEEIQEAQEQLKDMHGGKSKEFKKAKAERSEKLKNSAQKGDKEAYQKWKAEKGATKGEKFTSGAKKVGGFLGGLGKRFIGKAVSDVSDQLFGAPEKKEEAKEATASSGSGGAGLAGVLEEKIAENQRLKALLKDNDIPVEKGA